MCSDSIEDDAIIIKMRNIDSFSYTYSFTRNYQAETCVVSFENIFQFTHASTYIRRAISKFFEML